MPKLTKDQILEGLTYRKAALHLITNEGFADNFEYLRLLTRDVLVNKLNYNQLTPSFENCEDEFDYLVRLEKSLGFVACKWKYNLNRLIEFLDEVLKTDQFDEMKLAVSEFKELRDLMDGTPLRVDMSISLEQIPNMVIPDHHILLQGNRKRNSLDSKPLGEYYSKEKILKKTLDLDRCYAIKEEGKRGLCLIVNIYRKYSANDVSEGRKIFEDLNYKVLTLDNITARTYVTSLRDIRKQIKDLNSDSFILIFSSHGDSDNVIFSDEKRMPRENIILDFLPSYCPFLAGKPKLFFFQNCRGNETYIDRAQLQGEVTDFETDLMSDAVHSEKNKIIQNIRLGKDLPTDIVRFYATTDGNVAYRLSTGSIFLQSLYEILRDEELNRESLNEVQSDLVRRVTYYSQDGLNKQNKIGGQVPEFKSSLVKKYYFRHPHL